MADKKIDIQINTKANTAGAEQAQQAIADVQRQTDAARESEAAAARQADEAARAEAQAADVATINRRAAAMVLQQAGQAASQAAAGIREFAKEISEIDPESAKNIEAVAKGFDTANLAAQGAALGASFGGPLGAAVGAVALPGIKLVTDEIQAAIAASANLKQLEQDSANLPQRLEQVKNLLQMRDEIASWEDLTTQIKAAATEAELMSKVVAAQNSAKVRLAQADVDVARLTGGDVEGAENKLREVKQASQQSERDSELAAAVRVQEVAATELANAEAALHAMNIAYVTRAVEDLDALKKEMDAAAVKLEAFKSAAIKADNNLYLAEKRGGFDDSVRTREDAVQSFDRTQVSAVKELEDVATAAEKSGNVELKPLVEKIRKVTQDSIVTLDELKGLDQLMAENSRRLMGLGGDIMKQLEDSNRAMDEMRRAIQQISATSASNDNRTKG